MKVEFTPSEWASRSARLRRVRIRHECGDPKDCHVFVCRDRVGHSCGRLCCQGVGGAEDNRCSRCWCAFEHDAKRLLLEHLSTRAWAREDVICRHFGCYDTFTVVEDALRALVIAGHAHWFGPDDAPLKYLITREGHAELARLNRARKARAA